jgi:hypothetical protein
MDRDQLKEIGVIPVGSQAFTDGAGVVLERRSRVHDTYSVLGVIYRNQGKKRGLDGSYMELTGVSWLRE